MFSTGLFLSMFSFIAQLAEIQKFHNSFWMEITIFTHFIFHVTKVITFFLFDKLFLVIWSIQFSEDNNCLSISRIYAVQNQIDRHKLENNRSIEL